MKIVGKVKIVMRIISNTEDARYKAFILTKEQNYGIRFALKQGSVIIPYSRLIAISYSDESGVIQFTSSSGNICVSGRNLSFAMSGLNDNRLEALIEYPYDLEFLDLPDNDPIVEKIAIEASLLKMMGF